MAPVGGQLDAGDDDQGRRRAPGHGAQLRQGRAGVVLGDGQKVQPAHAGVVDDLLDRPAPVRVGGVEVQVAPQPARRSAGDGAGGGAAGWLGTSASAASGRAGRASTSSSYSTPPESEGRTQWQSSSTVQVPGLRGPGTKPGVARSGATSTSWRGAWRCPAPRNPAGSKRVRVSRLRTRSTDGGLKVRRRRSAPARAAG